MAIKFNTISRSRTKMYANLYGIPGCGKTYSALTIATTLVSANKKVLIIDTEGRANIYAPDFPEVMVYNLTSDQIKASTILEIISEAKKQLFECVIIDSLTPLWENLSAEADKEVNKKHGANWKNSKIIISSITQALASCDMHIITTSLAQDVLDANMKPTNEIKPAFERKKFEPYLDVQLMLKDNGKIAKAEKFWHHDLKDIFKIDNIINIDNIKQIKIWLGDVKGVNQNNSVFDKQLENVTNNEKLNDIFEEIKEMSIEGRKLLFTKKDELTKKIWKDNAVVLRDRITDYQEMKRLVEKDGIIKDAVNSSDFETEAEDENRTAEEPKKGEDVDNLL